MERTGLAGARAPAGFVGSLGALSLCIGLLGSQPRRAQADDEGLGASAHVPAQRAADGLRARELADLRRGLGDNFNPSESLPGTLVLFSGVPYVMVRGAPPGASASYFDGVPVPALFHLALGPAITHPSLLGDLNFHPGVAPARFGRHLGAVSSAVPARSQAKRTPSELELRLLDAQGLVVTRGAIDFAAHARVGYPGPALALTNSDATLGYWDYHARSRSVLGEHDTLEIVSFGASDRIGNRVDPADDVALTFHRGLMRFRHEWDAYEFGASVYVGHERGRLGRELTASVTRVGPEVWLETQRTDGFRMRLGADMEGKLARLKHGAELPAPEESERGGTMLATLEPDAIQFIDRAPLAQHPTRSAMGMYGEVELAGRAALELVVGLRSDLWLTAGRPQQALDPRILARWHAGPALTLHAGVGVAHQAAASPLPIPGLSDFELDYGLQSALQSQAGARLELPGQLTLEATGFYHAFDSLVFLELIVDCEGNTDPRPRLPSLQGGAERVPLCARGGLPRGSGHSYGGEFLLRRRGAERLNGWLSYSLSRARATAADGTPFVPQFDVRHVLNLVLAYRWGAGLESGLRLHFRSGKPAVNTVFDFAQGHLDRLQSRLPAFVRLDLNLAYHWATSWGGLWVMLQWLNVNMAREATKRDCRFDGSLVVHCDVDYQPAVTLPNAGLRAEF